MAEFFDVRATKSSENFGNKAKILGMTVEKQVEILNNTYKDKMSFRVVRDTYAETEPFIELDWVNPEIRILELPEVENLRIGYIKGSYFDNVDWRNIKYANLGTIKLPRTVKEFRLRSLDHMPNLTSVWLWDSTEVNLEKSFYSNIKMVVIQRTDGGKPIVYKL